MIEWGGFILCIVCSGSLTSSAMLFHGWGRGHRQVQKGQYRVTDKVNTITMRHGLEVHACSSFTQ